MLFDVMCANHEKFNVTVPSKILMDPSQMPHQPEVSCLVKITSFTLCSFVSRMLCFLSHNHSHLLQYSVNHIRIKNGMLNFMHFICLDNIHV